MSTPPPESHPQANVAERKSGTGPDEAELRALRRTLAEQLATMQWDLGGLAYEMAIRDHFRVDVLVRRAARLQEVDAELGAVERLLRLRESGAAGTCPTCGALHSRGAMFCEQCGTRLMAVDQPDIGGPSRELFAPSPLRQHEP